MQLMLQGHEIMGFVDDSTPCPAQFPMDAFGDSEVNYGGSSVR